MTEDKHVLTSNNKSGSSERKKLGIERVQALANISRSALYAFAMYKAISLHTCMLSKQRYPCTDC